MLLTNNNVDFSRTVNNLKKSTGCLKAIFMKLKLIINGYEAPDDYKLLRTTIATVASLRKTAILRFTNDRLIIISSPKSPLSSTTNNTVLHGDTGQLWCTIPKDVFNLYNVVSARELSTITMEYSCDSLLSVFKRYDRAMSQGSSSNITFKLQSAPEWRRDDGMENLNGKLKSKQRKPNIIYALGITFEEIVHTSNGVTMSTTEEGNNNGLPTTTTSTMRGSNKVIIHSFKIPVRLLYRAQDVRIQEPTVSAEPLVIKLPPISGEFGTGFYGFIKRVERYSNVNHLRLSGWHRPDPMVPPDNTNTKLGIIVNELDWNLEIRWNGPLEITFDPNEKQIKESMEMNHNDNVAGNSDQVIPPAIHVSETQKEDSSGEENNTSMMEEDLLRVEDSEMNVSTSTFSDNGSSLTTHSSKEKEINRTKELMQELSKQSFDVMLRCKDWKVCSRLYSAFDDVLLAIANDQCCVLHCSLDRGEAGNTQDPDLMKEKGQIIYYMIRSKAL